MTQELKHLIERIEREGVDKAEARAERIVSDARAKAGDIVRRAEDEAERIRAEAEADAAKSEERGRATLSHAARDVLLTVNTAIQNIMRDLVAEAVDEAMSVETVKRMLENMCTECALREGEHRLDILVGPENEKQMVHFFAERYKQKLARGVELHVDNDILKGFKVSLRGDNVYLDFTAEAVAEALSEFLRPHLAEIVTHAAKIEGGIEAACRELDQQ